VLPEVQAQFEYPLDITLKLLILCPLNILLGIVAAYYSFFAAKAALAMLGPLQLPVLALLVAYIGASFYVYSKPVDALTVHRTLMKQRLHPGDIGDGKKAS